MKRTFTRIISCIGFVMFVAGCGAPYAPAAKGLDLQQATFIVQDDTQSSDLPKKDGHTPTAACVDGSYSYSHHRSGTCSHHGGIARWYKTQADLDNEYK
jgi:hypothetical protein